MLRGLIDRVLPVGDDERRLTPAQRQVLLKGRFLFSQGVLESVEGVPVSHQPGDWDITKKRIVLGHNTMSPEIAGISSDPAHRVYGYGGNRIDHGISHELLGGLNSDNNYEILNRANRVEAAARTIVGCGAITTVVTFAAKAIRGVSQ